MNISTLYARRGQAGLESLAEKAGFKVAYLQRLLYVTERRPSIDRANALIQASNALWPGEGLTLEGLTNPVNFKEARTEQEKLGKAAPRPVRAPRKQTAAA